MELSATQMVLAGAAVFIVGLTRTGVPGLGIVMVPLLAASFGAKASTGVLLPMLCFADVFAVAFYKRHADWGLILRLLPWVLAGISGGLVALDRISSESLTPLFGLLIIGMLALKVAMERGGDWFERRMPRAWWFVGMIGILAGFTTAIGNIAGSIMGIYMISMGLRKHSFMGTSAWFYLIVNAIKLPFYTWYVGVVTPETLLWNVKFAPLILIGLLAGFGAFRLLTQAWFDRAVVALAAVAAARLILVGFLPGAPPAAPAVIRAEAAIDAAAPRSMEPLGKGEDEQSVRPPDGARQE